MDDLVFASANAGPLRLRFNGSDVLLFGEMTQKSGCYLVSVDGGQAKTYSAHCADGNMRLVEIIAEGLDPLVEHTIEITPVLKQGQELEIESLCVAGGAAKVSMG